MQARQVQRPTHTGPPIENRPCSPWAVAKSRSGSVLARIAFLFLFVLAVDVWLGRRAISHAYVSVGKTYTYSPKCARDLSVWNADPADRDEHESSQGTGHAPARTHGRAAPETCRPAGPVRPHVAWRRAWLGHVISHARWPSPHLLTAHSSLNNATAAAKVCFETKQRGTHP
jgi:hypothetical protein